MKIQKSNLESVFQFIKNITVAYGVIACFIGIKFYILKLRFQVDQNLHSC